MIKKAIKYLMILILIGMINVGVLLTCAFTQTGINNLKIETQTQIIKNITTEEAFNLIQENKDIRILSLLMYVLQKSFQMSI